jgi:hypothetical protein
MRVRAAGFWFTLAAFVTVIGAIAGCESDHPTAGAATDMFVPTGMRIHPIFTQVEDWNHDRKPDGIEAQLEFQDQFGDPTKAAGRVLFELFDYRRDSPDPRGVRVAGPWVGSLMTRNEQDERWNTTLRTYRFQLTYPEIRADKTYVLTAVFELAGGGRFFDRVILPGRKPTEGRPGETTAGEGRSSLPEQMAEPTTRHSEP